jgi:hypothetical protein
MKVWSKDPRDIAIVEQGLVELNESYHESIGV